MLNPTEEEGFQVSLSSTQKYPMNCFLCHFCILISLPSVLPVSLFYQPCLPPSSLWFFFQFPSFFTFPSFPTSIPLFSSPISSVVLITDELDQKN